MKIQAVLFDMGGTLETFQHTPELRLAATPGLDAILRAGGISLAMSSEALCRTVVEGWERCHREAIRTMDEPPAARVWAEHIFAGLDVDRAALEPIAEELLIYFEMQFFQRALRPEVPETLAAIRRMGLKIGLISNVGSRGQVPASLERYGIGGFFDAIVLSSEYGRRKPDPAIFHYAARRIGAPTSACCYVGDRIARDILGARRAGYGCAVQIVHDFAHGEEDRGAEPDAVIHALSELPDLLQAAQRRPAPSPAPLRALLFDAGDVLYHRPVHKRHIDAFLAEIGAANRAIPAGKRKELKDQAFHGEITQTQQRQALLALYGVTDPALVERGMRALEADDNEVVFFPGVRQTLLRLKAEGMLLGIITDTANPIHVKMGWFESGGFGHVWDVFISSQEVGYEKPDVRIYGDALAQLGLQAHEAAFVGHATEELQGARDAGLRTIAFNYEADAPADIYIKDFAELLPVALGVEAPAEGEG